MGQQTKDHVLVWVKDLQQIHFSLCCDKPHAMTSVMFLLLTKQWEEVAELCAREHVDGEA